MHEPVYIKPYTFETNQQQSWSASKWTTLRIEADACIIIKPWAKKEIQITISKGSKNFIAYHQAEGHLLTLTDKGTSQEQGEVTIRAPHSIFFMELVLRNRSVFESEIVPYMALCKLDDNATVGFGAHNIALLTKGTKTLADVTLISQKYDTSPMRGIGSAIVAAFSGEQQITGDVGEMTLYCGTDAFFKHAGNVLGHMKNLHGGDLTPHGTIELGEIRSFQNIHIPTAPKHRDTTLQSYFQDFMVRNLLPAHAY